MRAVLYIAHESAHDNKVSIDDMAEKLEVPRHFLAKILQQLSGNAVIQSTKGPGGGFYLSSEARKQPILRVIEVLDGPAIFHKCALGLHQCSADHPCVIHRYVVPFRDAFHSAVRNTSIDQLSSDLERGDAFITNLNKGLSGNINKEEAS